MIIITVNDRIELENKAGAIFERLPQQCKESLISKREYLVSYAYGDTSKSEKEHGIACYVEGLADAGMITYEEADILETYFKRNW